jgi:hypothetical protein
VQHAIGACAAGSTINKVDSAGNPTCVNSTYTAGTGLALASNQFRVDTTVIEPHIATAAARVDTPETRNNAGYGDLATTGPSATVTIPASGAALVTVTGQVAPPMGGTGYMSFAGANIGAADNQALIRDAGTSNSTGYLQASATFYVTGITPGSQTFTAKYRSSAGDTVTFSNRHLIVVPLP